VGFYFIGIRHKAMKAILVFLLLSIMIGCSNSDGQAIIKQQDQIISAERESAVIQEKPTATIETEVLHTDSVWLNDIIPFSSSQSLVKETLGDPDSVVVPDYECGAYIAGEEPWGDTVSVWFYKGTKIVTFKEKTEIMSVRLRGWETTLHHPRIILSEFTTMEDLSKVLPNSVSKGYDWTDAKSGLTYRLVRIAPKYGWDDEWVLTFYDNRLTEIEYWVPC
jgi:hypothetical protein